MKMYPLWQTTAVLYAAFAKIACSQATIDSGKGYGTYYYDVWQTQMCGADFSSQNQGNVGCSYYTPLSLNQINSNYVVAMNNTQLHEDMDKYCGKRVVVTVNGKKSDLPLFIGDGCQRCGTGQSDDDRWDPYGAPGLDFSYSVLSELSLDACSAGHVDVSWEIIDERLYRFETK